MPRFPHRHVHKTRRDITCSCPSETCHRQGSGSMSLHLSAAAPGITQRRQGKPRLLPRCAGVTREDVARRKWSRRSLRSRDHERSEARRDNAKTAGPGLTSEARGARRAEFALRERARSAHLLSARFVRPIYFFLKQAGKRKSRIPLSRDAARCCFSRWGCYPTRLCSRAFAAADRQLPLPSGW